MIKKGATETGFREATGLDPPEAGQQPAAPQRKRGALTTR
jgi:hypothetical protein